MAKTVPQMTLAEIEAPTAGSPEPYATTIAELIRRLRSRTTSTEGARQARIDQSVQSQLQGGSVCHPPTLLANAEALEDARDAYVLARIAGPSE